MDREKKLFRKENGNLSGKLFLHFNSLGCFHEQKKAAQKEKYVQRRHILLVDNVLK